MDIIFYTAEQVSEMTGMGRDWVWRMARDGKIPHHKLGGRYRWTEGDLIALAEQTAVQTAKAMGVSEAATYLGTSQNTIRDAIYRSQLPAVRLGTRWSILVDDLDKFRLALPTN